MRRNRREQFGDAVRAVGRSLIHFFTWKVLSVAADVGLSKIVSLFLCYVFDVFPARRFVHQVRAGASGSQGRALSSLEPELQVVLSCHAGARERITSSARAGSAHSCGAIALARSETLSTSTGSQECRSYGPVYWLTGRRAPSRISRVALRTRHPFCVYSLTRARVLHGYREV